MRKLILILAALVVLILVVAYYPSFVEKPEKDGPGPLSVWIDPRFAAPEYHSPLDRWQAHHPDMVNRGDLEKKDCQYCHEPARSCNNCHNYVGADPILEE